MTDNSNDPEDKPSWLERITQSLLGEPKNRAQLLEMLQDAEERGLLDADALAMIEGVLQVSEMRVTEIMVPRNKMVLIDRDESLDEILSQVVESGHSRFPVMGENRDDVVGILLAKDLLASYFDHSRGEKFAIRDILRPAVFIPESKRLDILLKEFRNNRNHMAMVVDEYGGMVGLVTIEDVLEQIVGDIEDEHDTTEDPSILNHRNNTFSVKATTTIEEFNEYFDANLNEEEVDTIGGLVLRAFGHLPKRGETTNIDNLSFTILRANKKRLLLLRVSKITTSTEKESK